MLVRQLEEELRIRSMQNHHPSHEVRQQVETMYAENDHLSREVAILRETVKELELRIETQKQTLQSRDESIKKLLEMLQNKGMGSSLLVASPDVGELERLRSRLNESQTQTRYLQSMVNIRDQELDRARKVRIFFQ